MTATDDADEISEAVADAAIGFSARRRALRRELRTIWLDSNPNRNTTMTEETYLNDGLYASFDGFMFVLRAPRDGGDHWVGLEPKTLEAFDRYRREVIARLKAAAPR